MILSPRSYSLALEVLLSFTLTVFLAAQDAPEKRKTPAMVEITAHRGASRDAPENTMAAVRLGWRQNADSVEVDVHQTKDGRVVVIHDADTKRTAGGEERLVADLTFAELRLLDAGAWKDARWTGERIPAIEEALETIPAGKRMFIEIKSGPGLVPELARLVRASGKSPAQIAIISFSLDACRAAKKAMPKREVYFLSGFKQDEKTGAWSPTAEELIAKALGAGLDGLDVDGRTACVGRDFIRKVHDAGLRLYVYTIDDPDLARRLALDGADGVTTNCPAPMREALRR